MKIFSFAWISIIIFTSCNKLCQNRLYKEFESKVSFYENVTKTEINKADTTNKTVHSFRIGYNSDSLEVIIGKSRFIEYDTKGRISKRYECWPERDPCCKRPFIYNYYYKNGRIEKITRSKSFINENVLCEKYVYDNQGRLIKKLNNDTTTFFYSTNDTLPIKKEHVSWVNNFDNEVVRTITTTTYEYNKLGLKVRETWINESGLSMTTQFIYDSKNRLIIEKDSSLNMHKSPNSYILIWKKYKYDARDRIIEELDLGGTVKEPEPHFRHKKIIKYEKSTYIEN